MNQKALYFTKTLYLCNLNSYFIYFAFNYIVVVEKWNIIVIRNTFQFDLKDYKFKDLQQYIYTKIEVRLVWILTYLCLWKMSTKNAVLKEIIIIISDTSNAQSAVLTLSRKTSGKGPTFSRSGTFSCITASAVAVIIEHTTSMKNAEK